MSTELETVTSRLAELQQQIIDTAQFLATKRDALYASAHEIATLERQIVCLRAGKISLEARRQELLQTPDCL